MPAGWAKETGLQNLASPVEFESPSYHPRHLEHANTYLSNRLKCNRSLPCDSCIKRGKEAICEYAPNADRGKTDNGTRVVKPSDRLQRLEDLVLQFMENSVSQSPASSNGTGRVSTNLGLSLYAQSSNSTDRASHGLSLDRPRDSTRAEANFNDTNGLLDVNGAETNYVDSSHWLSVLNEIKEVREYLQPGNVARESLPDNGPGTETSVDLVFGSVQHLQLPDILRAIPQRRVVDSLLSSYFNTKYMILRKWSPIHFVLH
jgi:hypothetical protein